MPQYDMTRALMDPSYAMEIATSFLQKKQYEEAIKYLMPHYNPQAENHNLEIVDMLAFAYTKLSNHEKETFSLLKIIYLEAKKNLRANTLSSTLNARSVKVIINKLNDMIIYASNKQLSNIFFQEALQHIENYPAFFCGERKNEEFFSLYHNIAVATRKFCARLKPDEKHLRKPYLEESISYFKQALTFQPNHLQGVLYIACTLVELDQVAQRGLEFLLEYNNKFEKNPHYHYALYRLYDLKDNKKSSVKHYNIYQKFPKSGQDKKLMDIFDGLLPNMGIQIGRAVDKYNHNKNEEAKEIVTAILKENPGDLDAMELSGEIERKMNHYSEALTIAEEILKNHPTSLIALKIKASCLWEDATNKESKQKAVAICEELYKKGYQTNYVLRILVNGNALQNNYEKVIFYGLKYTSTRPSASLYHMLAMTYFGVGDYENALIYLKKIQTEYPDYETREIFEYTISTLFCMADSRKSLKKCAKKMASYLFHLGEDQPSPGMLEIINELKKQNIEIHNRLDNIEEKNEKKSEDNENELYYVPSEIKAKILEYISKKSFAMDEDLPEINERVDSDDRFYQKMCDELKKMKPEDLKRIGPSGKKMGYISPEATVIKERMQKYEGALATERLLTTKSLNLAGNKQSKKDKRKYKLKPIGIEARLCGQSCFFAKGIPGLFADGTTIVRYKDEEPNHKRSSKQ